jgi:hypothetical protein
MDNVHKPSSSISFVLNENSAKCIALVAWRDGVHLDNEDAQKSTTFNITFDGVFRRHAQLIDGECDETKVIKAARF